MNIRFATAAGIALVLNVSAAAIAAPQSIDASVVHRPAVSTSVARTVVDRRADDRRIDNINEERRESCAAVLSETTTDIESRTFADIVRDRRARCLAERRGDNRFQQLRRDDLRDDNQLNQFQQVVYLRRDDRQDDRQLNQFRQIVYLRRDDRRDDRQLAGLPQIRQLRRDDRRDDRQLQRFRQVRQLRRDDRRDDRQIQHVRQVRQLRRDDRRDDRQIQRFRRDVRNRPSLAARGGHARIHRHRG